MLNILQDLIRHLGYVLVGFFLEMVILKVLNSAST